MGKVYDVIMAAYAEQEENIEINRKLLNFKVSGMTFKDVLQDYAQAIKKIRGDDIVFLDMWDIDEQHSTIKSASDISSNVIYPIIDTPVYSGFFVWEILDLLASCMKIFRVHNIKRPEKGLGPICGGELIALVS